MLRTNEQKQKICRGCPLAKTADLIGDSCTLLIIRDLLKGSKHFGDFVETLPGISTRTLSNKLKMLEGSELITRAVTATKPSRVVYSLTTKGRGLHSVTLAMTRYGEKYLE